MKEIEKGKFESNDFNYLPFLIIISLSIPYSPSLISRERAGG
jgi:hypothetical protein